MSTVVEYLRYRIDDARAEQFERDYATAGRVLDRSPECLGYDLARCVDEPQCYVLRIRWVSAQAHLQGFRRSPLFREFFAAIRGYVDDIEEMRHYAPTAVSGPGGAGTG